MYNVERIPNWVLNHWTLKISSAVYPYRYSRRLIPAKRTAAKSRMSNVSSRANFGYRKFQRNAGATAVCKSQTGGIKYKYSVARFWFTANCSVFFQTSQRVLHLMNDKVIFARVGTGAGSALNSQRRKGGKYVTPPSAHPRFSRPSVRECVRVCAHVCESARSFSHSRESRTPRKKRYY